MLRHITSKFSRLVNSLLKEQTWELIITYNNFQINITWGPFSMGGIRWTRASGLNRCISWNSRDALKFQFHATLIIEVPLLHCFCMLSWLPMSRFFIWYSEDESGFHLSTICETLTCFSMVKMQKYKINVICSIGTKGTLDPSNSPWLVMTSKDIIK